MRYPWIVLLSLVVSCASRGAEFCATGPASLQAHLDSAATNGQADTIRVAAGNYTGNFLFNSGGPVDGDGEDITIIGGYTEFFGNPCGQANLEPSQTVLDGFNIGRPMTISARTTTKVTIRNLMFINGDATAAATPYGGGLRINPVDTVILENNIFIGNTAQYAAAVYVYLADFIVMRNNVVVANSAEASSAVTLTTEVRGVHVINNTIIQNTRDNGEGNGGLYLLVSGTAQALIVNNILWGNDAADLQLFDAAGAPFYVYNNSIGQQIGVADESVGNVAIAPAFESGFFNYTLSPVSPLIDAGRTPPPLLPVNPPFKSNWSLPAADLTGGDRIQGFSVDIGAEESVANGIFRDGFE